MGARALTAQAVAPIEIHDPEMRALEERSFNDLKAVGQNIAGYQFNLPFYFSRKLDIDEKQQQRTDQHSIRFDRYNGATVIAISGNYYGAYSADKFSPEQRARETFLHVVVPILKAAIPAFQGNTAVQGYAIEVSHHVVAMSLGMPIERAENLMVYFPQKAAARLVAAGNNLAIQGALLDADVFLNANPLNLWLTDDGEAAAKESTAAPREMPVKTMTPAAAAFVESGGSAPALSATAAPPDPKPVAVSLPAVDPPHAPVQSLAPPVRDASPQALATLQLSIQGVSNHMVRELEPEAHFVTYAPPAFIGFHREVYLELSMTTALAAPPESSRYKLAALAFDEHISPLIRRVLDYFPEEQKFDGISFSTTVRGRVKPGLPPAKPLSVEFFLPLESLRRYASYDCTGQQLINDGIVLINGERVGLDLELVQGAGQP
jgi:hypothetical protein